MYMWDVYNIRYHMKNPEDNILRGKMMKRGESAHRWGWLENRRIFERVNCELGKKKKDSWQVGSGE